jgi:hypothetical protein
MIGTDIPKRETRDLWVAITIALSLGVYHLLFNIISFLQNISYQYYQLLSNLLFFWILALLWVAYRRWRNAVYRQRELRNILASIKPEVIMVVDSHCRIQMVNESVNIFGRRRIYSTSTVGWIKTVLTRYAILLIRLAFILDRQLAGNALAKLSPWRL